MANLERRDYVSGIIPLLATQFKESPNLIAYISVFLKQAQEIHDTLFDILEKRNCQLATETLLDTIGELVGQERSSIEGDSFIFFGFEGPVQSGPFGSLESVGGGSFRGFDTPLTGTRILSDEEYRTVIKSRVKKNNTKATPNDIISEIQNILGSDILVILSESPTHIYVSVGKKLTVNEYLLLSDEQFLSRPAGVTLDFITEFDQKENYFGLSMQGSSGFGSITDPTLGGFFSTLTN